MAESVGTSPTGHARHDPLRIAEAVDRGGRLASFLRFCDQCGRLYADLVALTGAVSLAALPPRPRDYTLRTADADRLRSGGWHAWGSTLGSVRDRVTRPLAMGLTTLGIVGLLLTAVPSLVPGVGSGAAPTDTQGRVEAEAGPDGIPTITMTVGPSPGPEDAGVAPAMPVGSLTATVSAGLIAVGVGLFALRRIAAHGRRMR